MASKKLIDRAVITKSTLMGMKLEALDNSAYNEEEEYDEVLEEFSEFIDQYDLYNFQIVEDASNATEPEPEPEWAKLIYKNEDGKFGIRGTSYSVELAPEYDKIECIHNDNVYMIYKDGKVGKMWIDSEGVHYLFDLEWDSISRVAYGKYFLKKDGLYYYSRDYRISSQGFAAVKLPKVAGWIRVKFGKEWGFLDGDLNFTVKEEDAHEFILSYGSCVSKEEITRGALAAFEVIENITKPLPSPKDWSDYEDVVRRFSGQLSLHKCTKSGKCGVEDSFGYQIIKPEYDEIIFDGLKDEYVFGRKDDKWALLIMGGDKLDTVSLVSDTMPKTTINANWMIVTNNDKSGLYNPLDAAWILPAEYDDMWVDDSHDCIITYKDDKEGFYSHEALIPAEYDEIIPGYAISYLRGVKDGKKGFFDKDMKFVEDIEKASVFTCDPYGF